MDKPSDPPSVSSHLLEEDIQELYENAPCAYLSTLPDGTIIKVNATFLKWTGYARATLVGQKRFQALLPVVGRVFYDTHVEPLLLMQGFVNELAFELIREDGQRMPILMNSVLKRDAAGNPLVIRMTILDAHGRRAYEEELRQAKRQAEEAEAAVRQLAEKLESRVQQRTQERDRIWRTSQDILAVAALNGTFLSFNPAFTRILGWDENDLSSLTAHCLVDRQYLPQLRNAFDDLSSGNPVDRLDVPLRHKIAGYRWLSMSIMPEGDKLYIVARDITEERKLSRRLRLAIEGIGDGIWDWSIRHETFSFFGGLKSIFGSAVEQQMTGDAASWLSKIHTEDLPRVLDAMQATQEGRVPTYRCQYRIRAKNGVWRWVQAHGVIVERDDDNKPLVMTGTLSDITDRKESDELIWRHANLDTLTELPNRRLFRERLELDLRNAKRSRHHLALLFIDLDGFKQVNDLYGHDAGDLLLIEVGQRIQGCVRETDTVARLGGDEFTVILTNLGDMDHIEFVCQKILARLADAFRIKKDLCYVSASIGASLYPRDAMTSEDLLRKADQAMYAAKHAGKNQFSYFTKEMDEKAHLRLQLTNELRHAINRDQLTVLYQPVIDLSTGAFMKAEALLRWNHPRLGTIEPAAFIPLAEESRLINQIGDWVFKQATNCCNRCSEQLRAPFQISVNKSPAQFMAQATNQGWIKYLAEQNRPGNSISIEITESILLQDSPKIKEMLSAYRDAGIQIALDDFGTGYASMSYLQKFHIDYLKIDQSFVRDITCNPSSRTIVESIVMLAHNLGQKVIAEGVETQEQLDYLVAAGCDYGQGYLFCHPISEDELLDRALRSTAPKDRHLI
jgi:diguanylate cyclase (GGDEF)-like protein/PAS domain S-box-containing protein